MREIQLFLNFKKVARPKVEFMVSNCHCIVSYFVYDVYHAVAFFKVCKW